MSWLKIFKQPLQHILWPIVGGLLGFVSVWLISTIWIGVVSEHIVNALLHGLLLMLVTALGAFAGGWAAFSAERRTENQNKIAAHVSAANKAIFQIARLYLICENLNDQFIKGERENKLRAVIISSPPKNFVPNFHFAFDELSFLLDFPDNTEAPNLLFELIRYEDNYNILVGTIDARAEAMETFAQTRHTPPVVANAPQNVEVMPEFRKLQALTDGMITGIDTTITESKRIYDQLRAVLQQHFQGQEFVKWDYTVKLKESL